MYVNTSVEPKDHAGVVSIDNEIAPSEQDLSRGRHSGCHYIANKSVYGRGVAGKASRPMKGSEQPLTDPRDESAPRSGSLARTEELPRKL